MGFEYSATAPNPLVANEVYYGEQDIYTGRVRIRQIAAPGAPTAALAGLGAGNLTNGTYNYKVIFVTATAETELGSAGTVAVVDNSTDGQVALSAIPTSSNPAVTSRKIYRTIADGASYFLLTTLANNTTTTYADNTADAGLGAAAADSNTTGSLQVDGNAAIVGSITTGKTDLSASTTDYVLGLTQGSSGSHLRFKDTDTGGLLETAVDDSGGAKTLYQFRKTAAASNASSKVFSFGDNAELLYYDKSGNLVSAGALSIATLANSALTLNPHGTGDLVLTLDTEGSLLAETIAFTKGAGAGAVNQVDNTFTRNITGNDNNLQGAVVRIEDTSTTSGTNSALTLQLGSTATSNSIGGNGTLMVGGAAEVNGILYTDGGITNTGLVTHQSGVAITAASYQSGRDADATNQLHFNVPTGASFEFSINDVAKIVLDTSNFKPGANDGLALGVSGTAFSDIFLASGAVIDFAAGDVTITHSANTLAFAGASSGYSYDAVVLPSANDAAALGSATVSWSDVFLASGAVLNFANSNLTVTHASGSLTMSAAGATFAVLGTAAGTGIVAISIGDSGGAEHSMRADFNADQFLLGVRTALGYQFIFTDQANIAKDHDIATQTNPMVAIFSAVDPDVSNNEYGYFQHDATRFIIGTGAATGAGSGPLTIANSISLRPRGAEVLRISGLSSASNPSSFLFLGPAHTTLIAGTETIGAEFDCSSTKQFAQGAITTQREFVVKAPTYSFATGSSTVTNIATAAITSSPIASTNAVFTNSSALLVGGSASIGPTSASMTYCAICVPAHTMTVTGGTQITSANAFSALSLAQITITDGSAVTVDQSSTLYIANAPVAAGSVTLTNPYAIFVDAGTARFDGRILEAQGVDVASANDLTLGADGNTFEITGTTQINAITTAGWQNGSIVRLLFTSNPTVKHNTAGGAGTAVILLAGAADFVASAGDTLSLVLSEIGGTQAWRQLGSAVI